MSDRLQALRFGLERRKGQRDQTRGLLREEKGRLKGLKREERDVEKARALVQLAGQRTQEQLRYHLSEISRLALAAVFPADPYEFEIAFERRRGRTEADFWFVRDGKRIDPRGNCGLGAVDVAGMSLRVSLWSLRRPRGRASVWVDEPFKHLKGEGPNKAVLAIFRELCRADEKRRWSGLQIVMIADERSPREDLEEVADRIFAVRKQGRQSVVETTT